MTPECSRVEELLSAMQAGVATPDEVSRAERHLATCAGCRATAAAFRRVDREVRRYLMATPVPELAAPWRNEPLLPAAPRGRGGRGHWRITLVGLTTVFVLLFAATVLAVRYSAPNPESAATQNSAGAAGGSANLPTAVAFAATTAPAASTAPAAAPAADTGTSTATARNGSAGAAVSAAPATSAAPAAAAAAPAPSRAAASAAPSAAAAAAPAASAAASAGSAPTVAPPPAGAPAATPTPIAKAAALNPTLTYGLVGATSLAVCRPDCTLDLSPEVRAAVVRALDQPLVPYIGGIPPATVRPAYLTLRFGFAGGTTIDIGYYPDLRLIQLPFGQGVVTAPPELIAALAGIDTPR